jgi:hypothetical protein
MLQHFFLLVVEGINDGCRFWLSCSWLGGVDGVPGMHMQGWQQHDGLIF